MKNKMILIAVLVAYWPPGPGFMRDQSDGVCGF
jgi:hypothetical protein